MRSDFPLYEGDSIIHGAGALALPKADFPAPAKVWKSPLAIIGSAIRALFDWIETGAQRARYRQLEGYLAESGDVFELERRIRNVERSYGAGFDPYS